MKPKVSILMPVYNAEQYLAQAIESISHQTFSDWELLLIDDGSNDTSREIMKQYTDPRIRIIINEYNLGLIDTLNIGIDCCKGKYIARMDADDLSHPNRLRVQVDFLEKHPSYILCGTNAVVIDSDGKVTGKIKNLSSNNFLKINLLFSVPFIHPSVMIRKEAISNEIFDRNYKHAEDYEMWCRLAKKGNIANINRELLSYRWHETNVSVANISTQNELKTRIIKNNLIEFGITPTDRELYYHTITFQLYALGVRREVSINDFEQIENWFIKLIEQNKVKQDFDQSDFVAFLWNRWLILCFSQKKISKTFFPLFASFSPKVIGRLTKLVLFNIGK